MCTYVGGEISCYGLVDLDRGRCFFLQTKFARSGDEVADVIIWGIDLDTYIEAAQLLAQLFIIISKPFSLHARAHALCGDINEPRPSCICKVARAAPAECSTQSL